MFYDPHFTVQRQSRNYVSGAAYVGRETNRGAFLVDNRPRSVAQLKLKNTGAGVVVRRKFNTTGLPDQMKSGIENLSGYSMDDVKVHYNSSQPAQLNAHAYAQGANIHIAPGQEKHLPHEAWHVVQQKQGRVKPTMQLKGKVSVNDDTGLEREADVMGKQALLTNNTITNLLTEKTITPYSGGNPIQCVRPGDAPPTMHSQLSRRFRQVATESNINPQAILSRMVQTYALNVPVAPVAMQLDHPLAAPPAGMADNIVDVALFAQMQAGIAGIQDLQFFKHAVINRGLGSATQAGLIQEFANAIDQRIDPLYHAAEHALLTDPLVNHDQELRTAAQNIVPGDNIMDRAATDFLGNARPQINELTALQKQQLTAALRTMPIVQSMLAGTLGTGAGAGGGAHLLTGIEGAVSQALIDRIQNALTTLADLVDGHVLPPAGRVPNIEINPDRQRPLPRSLLDRIRGIQRTIVEPYRANANRDNNRVRISAVTSLDVIVHEFAHQVEFALPAEEWLDIQELLRMRHAPGNLIAIYPDSVDADERNEAAFRAEMPATGAYSAKVYDDGSTEVMSMTMEYFSTPVKATRIIDTDPLQAAVILRIIKRNEFNNHVPAALRALLPRGDIAPPPAVPAPHVPAPVPANPGDAIGNDQL